MFITCNIDLLENIPKGTFTSGSGIADNVLTVAPDYDVIVLAQNLITKNLFCQVTGNESLFQTEQAGKFTIVTECPANFTTRQNITVQE